MKKLICFKLVRTSDTPLGSFLIQLHTENIKVEYVAITEYKPFKDSYGYEISSEASRAYIMCNVDDFGKKFLDKLAESTQITITN
jgi:hypothetical protein